MERLREQGHVFDEDGAVWVRTTDFGDDKDRVIRRANGAYTYFAADAAYYLSKKDRGFDLTIYLLGADHHGYVHRLKAIAGAAGDDPAADIEVLIGQLVSVNGAKLSKRAPDLICLLDLENGQPITTEQIRYGFRVIVFALPADPQWRTEAGIGLVGPRYFGYDFDYRPLEALNQ